jgi:phage/plasmid-like protein (TIGR03299 family)
MSAETSQWLNTMVLIGFADDKRRKAWHFSEADQGAEPNHYPGAIPVPDIKRRLFDWEPVTATVKHTVKLHGSSRTIVDGELKSYFHPRSGEKLGVVGKGHKHHGYTEWLIDNTKDILDVPELGVGSAGLLKKGAVAWVQIELDEELAGPGGIAHKPFFTSVTAMDGSMSTTYQKGTRLVVCDNTLSGALAENTDRVKIRHTSGSLARIGDIRQRLNILYQMGDDMNAELDELLKTPVSEREWNAFLEGHLTATFRGPRPFEAGRGQTNWDNRRDELTTLYKSDPRVSPWTGTAFGVVQAVNTHAHHIQPARGVSQAERNMLNMVKGEFGKIDTKALNQLKVVLAA